MKKYFLTTALMGTFIAPVFGADKIITSANTCTVDVLGVSDNNATANTIATWTLIDYECSAGQYLLKTEDSLECTPCPIGSYCPGGKFTIESENNGVNTCPTSHPNSAEGAGADTQCYTACTVDMVAKATAVTGNDYYGSGVDTCSATACETGYHVEGNIELVEKTPLIPVDYTIGGSFNNAYAGVATDTFEYGTIHSHSSCQPEIPSDLLYFYKNYSKVISRSMTLEDFRKEFSKVASEQKVSYAVNILSGALGNSSYYADIYKFLYVMLGNQTNAEYSTNDVGQYCYCQMVDFKPVEGDKTKISNAPWIFLQEFDSADNCQTNCIAQCSHRLRYTNSECTAFRAATYGALSYIETGICAANTINIDWDPDNGDTHIQNMCTYNETITLPDDPVKLGYTFSGWKLVEPTTTE